MYGYYPNVTVTASPTPSDDDDNGDQDHPVAPDNGDQDKQVDPACAECDASRWWNDFKCVKCKINGNLKKMKLANKDMSHLTRKQQMRLAQGLWEMKNEVMNNLQE